MKTKSEKSGTNTLDVEVTNISIHGFWLLISGSEYFLPFEKFPWFRNASIAHIQDVRLEHSTHLYWSSLDIDLNLDILQNPDQYPLVAS